MDVYLNHMFINPHEIEVNRAVGERYFQLRDEEVNLNKENDSLNSTDYEASHDKSNNSSKDDNTDFPFQLIKTNPFFQLLNENDKFSVESPLICENSKMKILKLMIYLLIILNFVILAFVEKFPWKLLFLLANNFYLGVYIYFSCEKELNLSKFIDSFNIFK